MATLITGPLESQLLKPSTGMRIPKLPDPPSLRDISSPRGRESPNKNPVVVTPEGLRIKFDEVHAEKKPLTKTPVQEHFNKEMEQLRKGVVEGIEGTPKAPDSTGKFVGNINELKPAERKVVNDLIAEGKTVERIPESTKYGEKTPDFKVDDVLTELKSFKNPNVNTGVGRIKDGFKQHAKKVIEIWTNDGKVTN